ncbi:MAG: hypothetical protein EXS15_04420 [Phycisphaerales bacterium]|nr:hypothetical protein [Phycisphaerales bacterium]
MPDSRIAVTHELRCIGCKHMLRGLPVTAQCPECGTMVMRTLVETLDMPSQALARPRHARRIASSMLFIGGGILLWTVGATAPAASRGVIELLTLRTVPFGAFPDQFGAVVSLLGAILLTIGSSGLSRRDDRVLLEETGTAGRWLSLGVGIWFFASAVNALLAFVDLRALTGLSDDGSAFTALAVVFLGASVAALGLRSFVTVLGRRCRRYRQAYHARQGIEAMIAAGAIALVASLGSAILPSLRWEDTAMLANVISLIAGGLLLMGAVYLMVNIMWIYRILSNPPPHLEDVIVIPGDPRPGESSN